MPLEEPLRMDWASSSLHCKMYLCLEMVFITLNPWQRIKKERKKEIHVTESATASYLGTPDFRKIIKE